MNTYIYFHENAGNIGMRMPLLKHMHDEIKCNILIVGYRGYGHSEGKPEEIGIGNDGEAMFKYALTCKDINPDWIFLYGKSLGGAVAIKVARKHSA